MRVALVLALLFAGAPVAAQDVPESEPQPGGVLEDDEFHVTSRQFGLERRVEMLQWRRDDDRYRRVWNEALIDSSGFDADHANPRGLPLRSRQWWAGRATLDGRPLAPEVLRTFGRWRPFRPGFSRLPGNLSATFQPEGDGLGSAENPLDPQVGDLRISWRELALPPLAGRVQLKDGVWRPIPAAAAAAIAEPAPLAPIETQDAGAGQRLWPWFAAIAALLVALFVARRRRHRRQCARAEH